MVSRTTSLVADSVPAAGGQPHLAKYLDPNSVGFDLNAVFGPPAFPLTECPPYGTYPCSSSQLSPCNEFHYCRLLKLCDSIRAPREFFDKILEWGQAASNDGFNWNRSHVSRSTFTTGTLQKKFPLPPPHIVRVPIERMQGTPCRTVPLIFP